MMNIIYGRFIALIFVVNQFASADEIVKPVVEPNGTIHVPAFDLPESAFLSQETREALKYGRDVASLEWKAIYDKCPASEDPDIVEMTAIRRCRADEFYKISTNYKSMRDRYDVDITSQMIDGVYVEIFTPSTGIKRRNRNKVLINVHGGGFTGGSRVTSQLESIPIAALGQIKVISIDYRMAPEYQFPAASEDIETVYRQLLKKYKPKNIGLYGCSAGGMLTAQSIAWFLDKKLPLPAAIGMFCLGAGSVNDSRADAAIVGGALFGFDWDEAHATNHYFQTMSPDDPLAYPGDSPTVLKEFPPSLLITGTRDFALSSVVKTHTELNRLDVEAELYVWEGQKHAFHFYPDIPESREAYDVIVKFFDKHLGK